VGPTACVVPVSSCKSGSSGGTFTGRLMPIVRGVLNRRSEIPIEAANATRPRARDFQIAKHGMALSRAVLKGIHTEMPQAAVRLSFGEPAVQMELHRPRIGESISDNPSSRRIGQQDETHERNE
jgi:hypothetical protein